jgi:hypothetical protein
LESQSLGLAHRIPYQKIENLKGRYVPKIQCYGSGIFKKLDEISVIERPEIKVAIIHESLKDSDYCHVVKKLFKNRDLKAKVWDRNDILPGANWSERMRDEVSTSDVVIALISADLLDDEVARDDMLDPSVSRANQQKTLLLGIVVRDCANWKGDPILQKLITPIHNLSDEPSDFIKEAKKDRAWSKVWEKLDAQIDDWLDKTHRIKLK